MARLALGESLRAVASAAIDVSDGLLADAAHMADASEVAIDIDYHRLPLSDALRALPDQDQSLRWALSGGDDYELLFTLPPGSIVPAGCTEIGRVVAGGGVSCAVMPQQSGHDHFTN
jgi:thiamine-monophosphate kinase